jgi:hypothetical protein
LSKNNIRNTGEYISICAKVCAELGVPYIVSPWEADVQVVFTRRCNDLVIVTGDADILAYGHKKVVVVKSWRINRESFRFFDLSSQSKNNDNCHVLYRAYCLFGVVVFQVWAAVVGCDISVKGSGVNGVGVSTLEQSLEQMLQVSGGTFDIAHFSQLMHSNAPQKDTLSSVDEISSELHCVIQWFASEGSFYDDHGNVISVGDDGKVVHAVTPNQRYHMLGKRNPKSPFGADALPDRSQQKVDAYKAANMYHNSLAEGIDERGSLPPGRESLEQCKVTEMQKMVIARGGSIKDTSGRNINKKELVLLLKQYLFVEEEVPSQRVIFDRDRTTNGLFAQINTDNGANVPKIISEIIQATSATSGILLEVHGPLGNNKFKDDFDYIALNSPELKETTIRAFFMHIGYSQDQKTIGTSMRRVMDLDAIMYHAIADGD